MNRKKLLTLGLVVTCLVSFIYQTLPSYGQEGGDKKSLVQEIISENDPNFAGGTQPVVPPPNEFMGNLLLDHTSGVSFFVAAASQIFPDMDNQYYESAEEFTVPAGGWTVGAMEVMSYEANYTGAISSIVINFYNDAGGPGSEACSQTTSNFTPTSLNIIAEFDNPCTLNEGTYWVSFRVVQPFLGGGQWFWARKPAEGSAFYFRTNLSGNTTCTTWTPYDVCRPNGFNYGLAFRLYEWSDIVVPTPTSPAPTTNIITVTTTTDELITDGDCALREAILAANYDFAFDACPAGVYKATDIIVLANGATYTLSQVGRNDDENYWGDLDIFDNVAEIDMIITVAGNGTATIDGNYIDRILHVLPFARVEVNGITFTHGQADAYGGAIWNQSYLVLNNSIVTNNSLSASVSYGGGIHNSSMLFIENGSQVTNNTARFGGGVYNDNTPGNTLTLTNSTVSNNTALNSGGGIYNGYLFILEGAVLSGNSATHGGAIYNDRSDTQLIGALLSNNSANGGHGGAIYSSSYLTINQSRLLDNFATGSGAAVFKVAGNSTVGAVDNSCVVGNIAQAGYAIDNMTGTLHDHTGNWWGASDGPSGMGTGSGDSVSANVAYSNFLTAPIFGCANSPVATATPPPPSPTNTPETCVMAVNAPALISPEHRTHTPNTTPTFAWSGMAGAQSYRLMIYVEDRSFEYKKRVFNNGYTLQAPEALPLNKYLWRVRTQDQGCGTWTGWSKRNTLFIE